MWSIWPSRENNYAAYKFTGLWLELNQDVVEVERKTYSLLELVGDIGGLFDGLSAICTNFVAPVGALAAQTRVLSLAFHLVKREKKSKMFVAGNKKMEKRLDPPTKMRVPAPGWRGALPCSKAARSYRRRAARADALVARQLDLVKFIKR